MLFAFVSTLPTQPELKSTKPSPLLPTNFSVQICWETISDAILHVAMPDHVHVQHDAVIVHVYIHNLHGLFFQRHSAHGKVHSQQQSFCLKLLWLCTELLYVIMLSWWSLMIGLPIWLVMSSLEIHLAKVRVSRRKNTGSVKSFLSSIKFGSIESSCLEGESQHLPTA